MIKVQDATGLTELKPRTIIGVGENVFEIVPKSERGGQLIEFGDEKGNHCQLFVRRMGRPRKVIDARKRY